MSEGMTIILLKVNSFNRPIIVPAYQPDPDKPNSLTAQYKIWLLRLQYGGAILHHTRFLTLSGTIAHAPHKIGIPLRAAAVNRPLYNLTVMSSCSVYLSEVLVKLLCRVMASHLRLNKFIFFIISGEVGLPVLSINNETQ